MNEFMKHSLMSVGRAVRCDPCCMLSAQRPFAAAGRPQALNPSRRCKIVQLASLSQDASLQCLSRASSPQAIEWADLGVLGRRAMLLTLLTAACTSTAQAETGMAVFWSAKCLSMRLIG